MAASVFLSGSGSRKADAVFGRADPVQRIRHFNNREYAAGSFHWLFPLERKQSNRHSDKPTYDAGFSHIQGQDSHETACSHRR
jgi:hypothetical protein